MKKRTRAEELIFTRNKILTTARDLFMEKGYRSVSTRDIAALCQMTQPALYHHFKDKESLYVEVVRQLTVEIHTDMIPIEQANHSPQKQLKAMLMMLIENHPTNILMMIHDILNELKKENQFLMFQLWQSTYLDPFKRLFERISDDGMLRTGVTSEAAASYCLSTISPIFASDSPFRQGSMSDRIDELIDFMMFGICEKEV
ncbi:TetR/AcrR family transcriptional regulator [Listeria grandensis]|uniref:TetR/AcrR family transcriptional regulator n=1 Tax=Listeria grandensis TaxID=1494963 RepID=A0A7X1CQD3_9LIST|nr:TetR/AcrR family transcriptional regulator [Listeria grandensis]MBC1474888.1 TetR/AcrR family transcriptional regulator [Listeria grandensis]MBC1936911.1 TetR/AcrR family transcriptional regulator [Listeria grandensis]